jgi:outer membrane protein
MNDTIHRASPLALVLACSLTAASSHAQSPAPETRGPGAENPAAFRAPDAQSNAARPSAPPPASLDELLDGELGAPGGLTAEQVAERAAETSPTVAGRGAELSAANASLRRATLAYLPTTTLTARYARLSDTQNGSLGNLVAAPGAPPGQLPDGTPLFNVPLSFENPLDQYTLSAGMTVPLSDYFLRLRSSREAAEHGVTSATGNYDASRRKAKADARLFYYDWVRARLGLIVAQQALTLARAHLEDARTAFRLGTVSNADVLRVESQVAENELLVTTRQHQTTLTEERLRTVQHDGAGQPYRIGEDVRQPLPGSANVPLAALWAEAFRARPELEALAAEARGQRSQASVERAAYGPRLDGFANAQYSNPNSRVFPLNDEFRGSWDAGLQLTWVISDAASAGARSDVAEARSQAAEQRRAELADAIRLEVLDAEQAVQEAEVAKQTSARGLAAAEESYRARRLLFQNGRATTVELLDAETDLTRARLEALGAFIDSRVAAVRLAYAVGR